MKLEKITAWLDKVLNVGAFNDVSNNGLQIECHKDIETVAVAVDASLRSVESAIDAGAQMLIVHHGISWGGGIKRLTGGIYNVIKAALGGDLAIYACHLPLDAHPTLGNNVHLAKNLGLKNLKPAFNYHGNTIGYIGTKDGLRIGVCSGGAGEFAEEAKRLGCELFVTGEATWGDVIAADNCNMKMECRGHYDTEVYGVRAVGRELKKTLKVKIVDLT